jgi:asparagine synthase (glutamine-hydrolysing)
MGLLRESVKGQLVSDVPVGILMSGGLDSTLVATLAAQIQPGIQAFTMAFDEPTFDESHRARLVAERIGCRHHIEVCRASDVIDLLPRLGAILDEPLADASILPTFLLTRFAAQSVKVALGGDGGDELFAGYPTFQALKYRSAFRALPKFARRALAYCVEKLKVSHGYLSVDFKLRQFLRGVDSTAERDFFYWMGAFTVPEQERLLSRTFRETLGGIDPLEDLAPTSSFDNDVQRCLYLCAKHYLQDGVLVKTDRASMANSLEVRAPFLDLDLVDFAARCPLEYKMTMTQTKWILRQAARGILPGEVVWASKRGFAPPIGKWILGELNSAFRDMLHPARIRREGIFEPVEVERLLDAHLSGTQNNARLLWTLFVFELWKERLGSGR